MYLPERGYKLKIFGGDLVWAQGVYGENLCNNNGDSDGEQRVPNYWRKLVMP